MIEQLNDIRRRAGLELLSPSSLLDKAAERHVIDLASGRVNLSNSHIGSDQSTVRDRVAATGYRAISSKEATGWGYGTWDESAQIMFWLNSPPHRLILLDPRVKEIGVAYLEQASSWTQYTRWWVIVLAQPVAPSGDYVVHVPIVAGGKVSQIDLMRFKLADPECFRVVRHPQGSQEDVQDMELGDGLFVRRKGGNGEWHRYDDQFFYLVHDTSPDPGVERIPRVYTLYKNGRVGAPKSRRYQAVGEQWHEQGLHRVVFRAKDGCRSLAENSGDAPNHSVIERYERNFTFDRYGQSLTFEEVIWERTGVEMQIYGRMRGRSCGWIGWEAPWGSSEPAEIHWDRGRLTQEPDRVCGF